MERFLNVIICRHLFINGDFWIIEIIIILVLTSVVILRKLFIQLNIDTIVAIVEILHIMQIIVLFQKC